MSIRATPCRWPGELRSHIAGAEAEQLAALQRLLVLLLASAEQLAQVLSEAAR